MREHRREFSRRRFLSTSLAGLATAGLTAVKPDLALGETDAPAPAPARPLIRTLGRTGIEIPVVSMGVMNANAPEVVAASYELGVRHFDTAARYQYGRNEQMVGDVIRRLGVRDKVVIGTKIMRPAQRGVETADMRGRIVALCEGSLRRLKTDYVDILYIHSVVEPEDYNDDGVCAGLTALKEQGKVRAVGVSTHRNMAAVLRDVTSGGFYDVVLTPLNVSMADDTELLDAITGAHAAGIGVIAMKTQAGGARLPNPDALRNYPGAVIATAALKWVLRHEEVTTAIPGYDNFDHMRQDLSVIGDLAYTAEEERFLTDNEITLSLGFCRQCERCLPTCPRGSAVPDLMRTYMYAAQYANFHEARTALDGIAPRRGLANCADCPSCSARCAHTVDIPHRIEALRQMYA